jgi:predicted phage terminase large subunit-like protein
MSDIPENIQVPDLLRHSPFYFVNKVFGFRVDGCHEQMLEFLNNNKYGMLLCPRGHGKSKMAQGLVAWLAVNNPDIRIIIVSDTDTKARLFLTTIKNILEYSPVIKEYYGDITSSPWTESAITVAGRTRIQTEPTVLAVGSGSGKVTGMHSDIILLDDIESFDSARSELQRTRLKDWYKTTLSPVLMAHGKTIVCGTRYHFADFYSMLDEEFSFEKLILPAINKDGKALCEWLVPLDSKYGKDGKLLVKGLSTIKAELGSVIYALQYMNDTSLLSAGTIFRHEDFRFYKRFIFDDNKVYVELLDGTKELIKRIVIGIDLAISEKQTADYTAMIIAGKTAKGNIYILDYINKRLTFNKQLHLIENLVEKWTPNEVAIEKVAYQEALIDELKRRGGLKIMAISPTRDKVARAYLVSGLVESNLVHFKQEGMSDVTDNLTIFPDGEHDDIADAFVYTLGRLKIGSVEPIMLSF